MAFSCFSPCLGTASLRRKQLPPDTVQIARREESEEMEPVLLEPTVAHLPEFPLALDDLEWVFDEGTDGRELPVPFLLRGRERMVRVPLSAMP